MALHAPLDVILVRKIGAAGNAELGIGAVAEGGHAFRLSLGRTAAPAVAAAARQAAGAGFAAHRLRHARTAATPTSYGAREAVAAR